MGERQHGGKKIRHVRSKAARPIRCRADSQPAKPEAQDETESKAEKESEAKFALIVVHMREVQSRSKHDAQCRALQKRLMLSLALR